MTDPNSPARPERQGGASAEPKTSSGVRPASENQKSGTSPQQTPAPSGDRRELILLSEAGGLSVIAVKQVSRGPYPVVFRPTSQPPYFSDQRTEPHPAEPGIRKAAAETAASPAEQTAAAPAAGPAESQSKAPGVAAAPPEPRTQPETDQPVQPAAALQAAPAAVSAEPEEAALCPAAPAAAAASPEQTKADKAPAAKPLSDAEVLAHTAQKWKYKDVPPTDPEPAEQVISCERSYGNSRVIGARVRGKKHKHEGTNCDDWFETAAVGDIILAAVSDGAGSKRFSRIGARVSCETAVQYLQGEFTRLAHSEPQYRAIMEALSGELTSDSFQTAAGQLCSFVQKAVSAAVTAVEAAYHERCGRPGYEIAGRDLQLTDFACTLLVAAAVPTADGEYLLITCQVGDGSIVSFDTHGSYPTKARILGEVDSGEFSGQTDFITSDRFKQLPVLQSRTRVYRGRGDLVMLMTDGVADDYHPNETQMTALYYDLIANGILLPGEDGQSGGQQTPALPEPTAYPWVNNQDVLVPLHYIDQIVETSGLSPEQLWDRREVLAQAGRMLPAEPAAPEERLAVWLDNYVKRGSFDDRTLVLLLLGGGAS